MRGGETGSPLASRLRLAALAAALLLGLGGCASVDRSVALTEDAVVPFTVGDAAAVSAYDLAEAMLRAGFTREQILQHGPEIRTALATAGGAQFRSGKMVEALFAVHGEQLYITSRTRGTFAQAIGDYAEKSF